MTRRAFIIVVVLPFILLALVMFGESQGWWDSTCSVEQGTCFERDEL